MSAAKQMPIELKLIPSCDDVGRQFWIESQWQGMEGEWDDIYVDFGGYFGAYGPHMFALAPQLVEALKTASWLLADIAPQGLVKKRIDELLVKATGGQP